jgi:hypothetical protein
MKLASCSRSKFEFLSSQEHGLGYEKSIVVRSHEITPWRAAGEDMGDKVPAMLCFFQIEKVGMDVGHVVAQGHHNQTAEAVITLLG